MIHTTPTHPILLKAADVVERMQCVFVGNLIQWRACDEKWKKNLVSKKKKHFLKLGNNFDKILTYKLRYKNI